MNGLVPEIRGLVALGHRDRAAVRFLELTGLKAFSVSDGYIIRDHVREIRLQSEYRPFTYQEIMARAAAEATADTCAGLRIREFFTDDELEALKELT